VPPIHVAAEDSQSAPGAAVKCPRISLQDELRGPCLLVFGKAMEKSLSHWRGAVQACSPATNLILPRRRFSAGMRHRRIGGTVGPSIKRRPSSVSAQVL